MCTVRRLADEIGPRVAGSSEEKRAAEYMRTRMEDQCLNVTNESFKIPGFIPQDIELEVLNHPEMKFDPVPFIYSGTTQKDGIEGDIVCLGDGGEMQYEQKEIEGKMVLIRQPNKISLTELEKTVERAAVHGACGLVTFEGEGPPRNYSLPSGRFEIPCVSISSKSGQELLMKLIDEGTCTIRLNVRAQTGNVVSQNIIGIIEGHRWKDEKILLTAHLDSVIGSPGANDNASGLAVLLDIAELLGGERQAKTIQFVAFGSEEPNPYCMGSRFYVREHGDELENIKALLNFDQVGVGAQEDNRPVLKTIYLNELYRGRELETVKWLDDYIRRIAEGLQIKMDFIKVRGLSDHVPFALNGVPAQMFRWMDDPWYHSCYDKSINVDPDKLKIISDIAATTALELAN
jgi:aminopeptidase YwaD